MLIELSSPVCVFVFWISVFSIAQCLRRLTANASLKQSASLMTLRSDKDNDDDVVRACPNGHGRSAHADADVAALQLYIEQLEAENAELRRLLKNK